MPRETADDKARRLLVEGRLQILTVDRDRRYIHAQCRGSDGVYDLGFDPHHDVWRCTCEASAKFGRRCSHLRALQLVVTKPSRSRPTPLAE